MGVVLRNWGRCLGVVGSQATAVLISQTTVETTVISLLVVLLLGLVSLTLVHVLLLLLPVESTAAALGLCPAAQTPLARERRRARLRIHNALLLLLQ